MLSISSRNAGGPADPSSANKASAPGGAAAAPEADENRVSPRRPAASIPSITGLRFKPHGVEAVLVDISESGLLAECGERLKPGTAVTTVFEGTFVPNTIDGRIVRTAVWAVGRDGRLRYHVGIEFSTPCPLPPDPSAKAEPPARAESAPAIAANRPTPPAAAARVEVPPPAPKVTPAPAAAVTAAPVSRAAAQPPAVASSAPEEEVEIEIPLTADEPADTRPVVRNRW